MEHSSEKSIPLDNPNPSDCSLNQETSIVLQELVVSIQELVKRFSLEHHDCTIGDGHSRANERDLVLEAINEEINDGRSKPIPSWEKIEVMSPTAVEEENRAHLERYEGIYLLPFLLSSRIWESHVSYSVCTHLQISGMTIQARHWK